MKDKRFNGLGWVQRHYIKWAIRLKRTPYCSGGLCDGGRETKQVLLSLERRGLIIVNKSCDNWVINYRGTAS